MTTAPHISSLSLSELMHQVRFAVQDAFPEYVWVRAEVSSLSARSNSHCYLELTEKGDDNQQFAAKVRANCWRNEWLPIAAYFEAITGQPLAAGMQILAEVSVDMHPVYGLSLVVHAIDPTFTLGDLARQKEETLRRLKDEGVYDMQQSLSLPSLPLRIAVISAASAAGYQDFVHQLTNNAYGFPFQITLFEALMQGDGAATSIIAALQEIFDASQNYDVVVLIRGGGASTDLSCFDRYDLAAHCAQFPLPIIAGIGHTRDVSVVDEVAFLSVKTPTAAAEYLIGLLLEQLTMLDDLSLRLMRSADKQIHLRTVALDRQAMRLSMALQEHLHQQFTQMDLIEKTIALNSPERIFRKGYSLTTCSGHVVRDAAHLSKGDRLRIEFASGSIDSEVL